MRSKKAQLTLWIIVAIVIVAAIALLFYLRIPQRYIFPSAPDVQLQNCIKDDLKKAIEIISSRGGSTEPVNSMMYEGEKVEYLCYTNQYYQTCNNQQPMLKQHIEREILEQIQPQAEKCVQDLKENLMAKGYSIGGGKTDISVSLSLDNIEVSISGFSAVKEEAGERYSKFEIRQKSQLYDLVMLTTSILNWEARYGDSDITTYMIYYPNIKIEKYKQSDGSKIYILTDTPSQEKFVFATRSLSWPAGYGFGETYKPIAT